MNDEPQNPPSGDSSLQFDRAEFAQPDAHALNCVACQQAIRESYFQINGKIVCPACRERFEAGKTGGSGLARFASASVFGFGAALLGAGIYFAVTAITGYELSLISILVGFMVGWAVRRGAQGRGGWAYQSLAIFLTYTAIVATYIPPVLKGFAEERDKARQAAIEPSSGTNKVGRAAPNPDTTGKKSSRAGDARAKNPPSLVLALAGLVALIGFAYIVPFLAGFGNIVGWIIIAIGLYEAWKMNQRQVYAVSGPFTVAAGGGAAPPALPVA